MKRRGIDYFSRLSKTLTSEFLPLIITFHAIRIERERKVGRNAQRWCYTFRKLNLPPDKFVRKLFSDAFPPLTPN